MSLVSAAGQATIAVAMRMRWPPDGSSADLEVTGAGYHHLPYDRLWLADDRGRRYTVTFDGEGGTRTWRGVLRMSPAPPAGARWLDLVADETNRLIRLDLNQDKGTDETAPAAAREDRRDLPGRAAARGGSRSHPGRPPRRPDKSSPTGTWARSPGALIEAGLITADNPAAARLAALCQRLGVPGPGPGDRGDGPVARAGGPASSRSDPRRKQGPSCSRRWPRSCRTSTEPGSRWPGSA